MSIKPYLVFCLAAVCGGALGQDNNELAKELQTGCQRLARELNDSKKLGIRPEGIAPLMTWRASCAERPPTGPGDVTALCEGIRFTRKGEESVFFWQKSVHGKLNDGYFICGSAETPGDTVGIKY